MANEIWTTFVSGSVLYALVHRKSDDKVNIIGTNNFEAWNDANIATSVLAMTDNDGDYHSVDFTSAITDTATQAYRVTVRLQAGGSPVADGAVDFPIAQGEIQWNGSSEVDLGTVVITNQMVQNRYDESRRPIVEVIEIGSI